MRTVDAAGLPIGDGHPPRIMGVLNVSRESPYDPSVFDDPGAAAAYVDEEVIDEGADVVDVGLESANKRFEVLSAEEELDRLETAVAAMESTDGDAVWSIETRYHEVAEAALQRGFEMVNDVCGFADPEMPRVCEEYDVAVAKMASPPDIERPGALADVDDVYDALERNGFTEKTILDPAFGGWSEEKTLEDDRETFRRLREFRGYGRPILVSINRKNFLREIAGRPTEEALPVSLAATSMAVERGAHVVRTHDVAETRDAALVGHEFARERVADPGAGVEELDVTTDGEFARHLHRVSGGDAERSEAPGRESGDGGAESRDDPSVVTHVVELRLPEEDADHVARMAGEAGVRAFRGDGTLLVGTAAGFRDLRESIDPSRPAAERAVVRVCEDLE